MQAGFEGSKVNGDRWVDFTVVDDGWVLIHDFDKGCKGQRYNAG